MREERAYQSHLVKGVLERFDAEPRAHVMLQCPTGGGKTEMAADVIEHLLNAENCAIWLTHRQELRAQLVRRFTDAAIPVYDMTADSPEDRRIRTGTVNIVSPGMRGVEMLPHSCTSVDLLVIDEAHHTPAASWARLVRDWPGPVLGLTATVWRLDPLQGFDDYYAHLFSGWSTLDLVADGFLVPPRIVTAAVVRGNAMQAGDFTAEGQDVRVLATDRVIELWHDAVEGAAPPTVWYAPTVKAAQALSDTLGRAGMEAPVLHQGSPGDDRKRAFGRFRSGRIQHLVNVDILGEGVDVPRIGCVVLARHTRSLVWWLQAAGRALRRGENKSQAVIVDLAASVHDDENAQAWAGPHEEYTGSPFSRRAWSLYPRSSYIGGDAPVSKCVSPGCGHTMHPMERLCERCGAMQFTMCYRCWREIRLNVIAPGGLCMECSMIEGERLRTQTVAA